MNEPEIHTLSNGIRIAHKQITNTKVMHCGLILNIGSRDEEEHEMGLAHFWEHMVFKGTEKRKAYHIINRLDSLGGELNAYTTKEKISFYASVMDNYFERAVELLQDIVFHSTYPEKQLEREKGVVLEEMSMYDDSPEDSLHDEFDNVLFGNHPLGFNILGTKETVSGFTRDQLSQFISKHLCTSEIVFSSVGNLPFKKVKKIAEKYFADLPEIKKEHQRKQFNGFTPKDKVMHKPVNQSHCAMGIPAYPFSSEKKPILFMLNNILGGPAMNSRLNMSLRERKGYVYSVESSYITYEDTGIFSVYFATAPGTSEKVAHHVWKELDLLKNKKLGINQLKSAKEQLIGQIAISEEKNAGFMLMMGKSILDMGRVETLSEIFNKINTISPMQIMEVANEILKKDLFSSLKYLPQK